jgi:hypothetical protein
LARGDIVPTQAFAFLALQLSAGLAVLLQLDWYRFVVFTRPAISNLNGVIFRSILLGASSLSVVSIYPFMKRITYWPQAVLGDYSLPEHSHLPPDTSRARVGLQLGLSPWLVSCCQRYCQLGSLPSAICWWRSMDVGVRHHICTSGSYYLFKLKIKSCG